MLEQIRSEINTLIGSIDGMSNWLYYMKAPEGVEFPYCVYEVVVPIEEKDTENKYETYYLQFNVWDDSVKSSEGEAIMKQIQDALDESEGSWGTMTDYEIIAIDCVKPIRTIADIDSWQIVTEYKLQLKRK